jgi:hypothetical protein
MALALEVSRFAASVAHFSRVTARPDNISDRLRRHIIKQPMIVIPSSRLFICSPFFVCLFAASANGFFCYKINY